jgi:hypothetical protein
MAVVLIQNQQQQIILITIPTSNQNYELEVTQAGTTVVKKFCNCKSGTVSATMPTGLLDGINYNTADASKATLVLDAPLNFIYVAGTIGNHLLIR